MLGECQVNVKSQSELDFFTVLIVAALSSKESLIMIYCRVAQVQSPESKIKIEKVQFWNQGCHLILIPTQALSQALCFIMIPPT